MHNQYIAGFIDGEGHMGIIKSPPSKKQRQKTIRYTPKITIVNTNKHIMVEIQKHIGGCLSERKRESEKHRQTYSLQIYGKSLNGAIPFLKRCLIIKKAELECLIEMIKTQRPTARGNQYTKAEMDNKEKIYQKCLMLKKM